MHFTQTSVLKFTVLVKLVHSTQRHHIPHLTFKGNVTTLLEISKTKHMCTNMNFHAANVAGNTVKTLP